MASPGLAREQLATLVNQAQHLGALCRGHPCRPSRAASGQQGLLHSLSRASLQQTLQGYHSPMALVRWAITDSQQCRCPQQLQTLCQSVVQVTT